MSQHDAPDAGLTLNELRELEQHVGGEWPMLRRLFAAAREGIAARAELARVTALREAARTAYDIWNTAHDGEFVDEHGQPWVWPPEDSPPYWLQNEEWEAAMLAVGDALGLRAQASERAAGSGEGE